MLLKGLSMILKKNECDSKKILLIMLCGFSMMYGNEHPAQEVHSITLHNDQHDHDEDILRSCDTSQTVCRLLVTGLAQIGSLYVADDAVIRGTLRVTGPINTNEMGIGDLIVQGSSIHSSITVLGEASVGSLSVGGVPFTNAFVQDGNSFGAPAFLGTNDAQPLNIETSGIQRMQISSTGAVAIAAPASGVALTVNAGTNAIGLVVQGNGTARAATITAGNNTGGGLLIRSGTGAGVPLEVTAAPGQGNAATFIGNGNAATALTITPGVNRVGLTIEGSGTAAGLKVFDAAQVNTNHTYPLMAGGTEVAPGSFVPALGQTNTPHIGTPRMIWAHVSADSLSVSQSGGVLTVGHTGPGVYPITYDTFGSTSPIVIVTTEDGFVGHASIPTATGTIITTNAVVAGVLTPADASFSVVIMGLAS